MPELQERHYLGNGRESLPEPREALEWAQETRAALVDLKFCDLLGTWQHCTLPVSALDESAFDEGLGFDGSSIRGWQGISESALGADHEFLLRGGVCSRELVETWIAWKREHEVDAVRLRPHPAEFSLYFDC